MTVSKISISALYIEGNDDSSIVVCFDKDNTCDIEFNDCNRIRLQTLRDIISQAERFITFSGK